MSFQLSFSGELFSFFNLCVVKNSPYMSCIEVSDVEPFVFSFVIYLLVFIILWSFSSIIIFCLWGENFFSLFFVAYSYQMTICFCINLISWLVVASFSHDVFPFDFVDIDTRRRAACDLVRGLCKFFEGPVTGIFSGYVNSMLQEYAKNPSVNWKHKDAAIYLVTSLASKAQTQKVTLQYIFVSKT